PQGTMRCAGLFEVRGKSGELTSPNLMAVSLAQWTRLPRGQFVASLRLRLDPFAMFFDQIHQPFDSFGLGNVELDCGFADVKIDFVGGAAHIAKIGISHFAGAIYNATHDGDLNAFQVFRALLNPCSDSL